jgi:hypothetical protein
MGDPFKIVNKIILLRLVIDNQWIYFTLVSYHEEQRQEKSKNINKRNAIYLLRTIQKKKYNNNTWQYFKRCNFNLLF